MCFRCPLPRDSQELKAEKAVSLTFLNHNIFTGQLSRELGVELILPVTSSARRGEIKQGTSAADAGGAVRSRTTARKIHIFGAGFIGVQIMLALIS